MTSASSELRFDGRVAIVTGAGGGLGRQYALTFGRRGAKVVVNDLGGDIHGGGASSRPADVVVEEIKASGGEAVANYDSVEEGEKIVQCAIQHFGRIDILVNNAGILRDKTFARISEADWDIIHRVHLKGSFLVTRAAWPHMRKQKFGRIIMTSSAAGVFGNFGQANYSAAKLGLLGLSNTLALEGARSNIHCNTIVPTAGSRLTMTVMPPDVIEKLKPEYVAPLVAFLCHESCEDNGGTFEAAAGWMARLRWEETPGVVLLRSKDDVISPEQVRDNWDKINDFTDARHPTSIQESTGRLLQLLQDVEEGRVSSSSPSSSPPDRLDGWIGFELPEDTFHISPKDVALYALGVGVSLESPSGLKFLFEGDPDFCALPTFGVIACQQGVLTGMLNHLSTLDPTRILHGEQFLEVRAPVPTTGSLRSKTKIVDVLDKKKGALILIDVTTTDDANREVFFNQFVIYAGGAGGFGGKRSSEHLVGTVATPGRVPDAVVEEKTSPDQAALYRLSGDFNPLHIDPSFAAMGGLARPIIHGLCSLGFAVRHVLEKFADSNVQRFKSVKVRFSRPMLPGQTLQTNMWRAEDNPNRILFNCVVKETGEICLSGAYVDLVSSTPSFASNEAPLHSAPVLAEIANRVAADPGRAKQVNAVFLWNIKPDVGGPQPWTMDLREGLVYAGQPKGHAAECILEVRDDDFVAMTTGKLNAQKAFMEGKLKIKGNIMLSQKLAGVLKTNTKL